MKFLKQTGLFLFGMIMLFAFSLSCYAIEFDAEKTYESVFVIHSGYSEGSGFAIGKNTVVTNAHVVSDRNKIQVKTYSGESYSADVFLYNDSLDIAILTVEGASFTPLEVGDCESLKIGEDIYAIGAPKSMDYTLTKGVISNKSRTIGINSYIQIDAAINSGNSGGPLLNAKGQVIGVNSMKVTSAEGIALAIPISSVINFMEGNDVPMADDKTVEGEIEYVEPKDDGDTITRDKVKVKKVPDYSLAIIIGALLCISFIANIVLAVINAKITKKYNFEMAVIQAQQPDPSERTDFEIEIME